MPPAKKKRHFAQERLANGCGGAAPIHEGLEMPFEVRPAELSKSQRPPRVGAPTIRDEHAARVSQEFLGDGCSAGGANQKDRHLLGERGPEPGLLARSAFVPA